ncbi:tetratricopeptide repeat protein [Limobrevibacterium gyesilva]|uniref:Tetratricopeptide repeat protein n=1 Tax=Limobrevibacterium gyesilva TaxID=2991712 RepID=A0AA41YN14_9PROT|nr:tetratricopeptide repeat protein [Limobrevibacterium gyesilva]MCW3475357.1 tetratricopeptide repeat protein [Limobrevibacterium gyesilva]
MPAPESQEQQVARCRAALADRPDDAHAHAALGNALMARGRFDDAIREYRAGIAAAPDLAELHYNLGNALLATGQPEEGETCYRRALAADADHAGAHNNLGNALRAQGRHDDAIDCYQAALAIRPEYFGTLNNIGSALLALHRPEEAEAYLRRSLAARPDYAEACNNLGGALLSQNRPDEAVEWFRRAVALDADQVQARFGEGLALLSMGDFANGWRAYEARWQDPRFQEDMPDFPDEPWRGSEDVAGRRVLLHAEQGLGDSIQFVRYAQLVRRRGAHIVLQVQEPLVGLLRPLADSVIAQGDHPRDDPLPAYDVRCPLLSLPLAFATGLTTIPADVPYLHPAADRVAAWACRLGPRTRRRVGVAWSGSADHPEDALRSIPAGQLLPTLAATGVELHVVQKDIRESDAAFLAAAPHIRNHAGLLSDFGETAALLACMDLVISVDTAVAHLAGAMGLATWIMVQASADFRWMRGRTDTPWYPTARLFRQANLREWEPTIAAVAAALAG